MQRFHAVRSKPCVSYSIKKRSDSCVKQPRFLELNLVAPVLNLNDIKPQRKRNLQDIALHGTLGNDRTIDAENADFGIGGGMLDEENSIVYSDLFPVAFD